MPIKKSTVVIDTVSGLSSLKLGEGDIVQTRGYTNVGKGEAFYVYRKAGRSTHQQDLVLYFNGAGIDDYFELLHNGYIEVQQAGAIGDGTTNDRAAIQRALSIVDPVTIKISSGTFLVQLSFGDSLTPTSNTKVVFSSGAKIKVEYNDQAEWAPLFYINTKTDILFESPSIEWNADYVERDEDNDKYGLGLGADYFHSIWFIMGSSDITINSPKTWGSDDNKCYNHGVFLRGTKNVTITNVNASHYGSWLFGWNSQDNAEFTLSCGRFSKQTLKTNLHYGPGHPVYSFSGKSTILNITDDGTTLSYSEEIEDSEDDTITVSAGKFVLHNEVLVDSDVGGLVAGTLYYVVFVDGQTIRLSDTKNGTTVSVGSGISGVTLSLSDTMAGHTVKLRHNGSGTTDQIIVNGITSKSPSGVLDIVDTVQNSTFSNISWHSVGDGRRYSDSFVGALLLQGTGLAVGPTSCVFSNIVLESGASDICFVFMRAFHCSLSAKIICSSSSGFERYAFYMSYAEENDVEISYTEQLTTAANQRPMIRLDRRCRSNNLRWTLTRDIEQARTYGGKVLITGSTSSNFTAYPRDNRIVIERAPYFTPTQFEYVYYETLEAMSESHKQLVFWLNTIVNEHGNYALYDAGSITGTSWTYELDAPVLGTPSPTNYILSWTTFDTSDNYAVNQLMSGTWVGITGTARSCHNVQPISTAVTRGDALTFTGGDGTLPVAGQRIVGQSSGVTAYVTTAYNITGDWGAGSASGDLRYESCRGMFEIGETLSIEGTTVTVGSITTYSAIPAEIWATQDGKITLSGTRSQNITQGVLAVFSPLGVTRH